MNVGMKHGLPGRCADVRPEIEPGDQRIPLPDLFDEGTDQRFVFLSRIETVVLAGQREYSLSTNQYPGAIPLCYALP